MQTIESSRPTTSISGLSMHFVWNRVANTFSLDRVGLGGSICKSYRGSLLCLVGGLVHLDPAFGGPRKQKERKKAQILDRMVHQYLGTWVLEYLKES